LLLQSFLSLSLAFRSASTSHACLSDMMGMSVCMHCCILATRLGAILAHLNARFNTKLLSELGPNVRLCFVMRPVFPCSQACHRTHMQSL
jgi:hypothetical protein